MKQTTWTPPLPWGWKNTTRFKIHLASFCPGFPWTNSTLYIFSGFFGDNIIIYKKYILYIWYDSLFVAATGGCLGDIPRQIRYRPWFAKDAERIIWSRSSCGHRGLFCARNDAGRPGLFRSVTCLMMWGWRTDMTFFLGRRMSFDGGIVANDTFVWLHRLQPPGLKSSRKLLHVETECHLPLPCLHLMRVPLTHQQSNPNSVMSFLDF